MSKGHLSAVTCLAWHGDGEFLISGDEQGKILISSIDFTQVSLPFTTLPIVRLIVSCPESV